MKLDLIRQRIFEWEGMSSRFVMTSYLKYYKSSMPLVFTEHGGTMSSNVLGSKTEMGNRIPLC